MMKRFYLMICLLLVLGLPVVAESANQTVKPTATATADAVILPETTAEGDAHDAGCPVLVRDALELTKASCEAIGNNEVCYGHSTLTAAARPGYNNFSFDVPGDIEDVIEMQSLSLSPLDSDREEWGVILMRVEAEITELLQDAVTFVVFGDTELVAPTAIIEASVAQNANLRAEPNSSSALVGVILPDDPLVLNGRTEDGAWVRGRITDAEKGILNGWLAIGVILATGEADLMALPVVDADDDGGTSSMQYGPMQAFYFKSGKDDAPCAAAPNSGMLIQTPEGQATVTLWIDEVIIELDGTTYVQADADGDIQFSVLDGSANLTANGETRTAIAGTQITVPLDENLGAAGVPSDPVPLDVDNAQMLPIDLLENPVTVPEPLVLGAGVPASGNWVFNWNVDVLTCPDGSQWPFEDSGTPNALSASADGATILWGGGPYNRISTGVYTRSYVDGEGNLFQETLNVNAMDRIAGEALIDLSSTACMLTVPFSLQLVGR